MRSRSRSRCLGVLAPVAVAHQGNPNFRSEVRDIAPALDGVQATVVNYDDSIELRNRSGRTVVVEGYRGEPYVRIAADGTVSVNRRSPTYYLNDDRFAEGVEVPAGRDAQGHAGLARGGPHRALRLARPSHPLDGAHRAARR